MVRERVLIIHDDLEEIEPLRRTFEFMGFDPEIVLDPQMAAGVLEERTMKAIVVDLDRAKMEPYRWVKKLSEAYPSVPVIGLTEKSLRLASPRMTRHGGRAVLRKPIVLAEAVAGIEAAFRPRRKKRTRRSPSS